MNTLTILFLVFLAAGIAARLWLAGRHLAHVERYRDEVPEAFRARITQAAHRKAADYTGARTRLGRWETLFHGAVLLAWTLGGGLELADHLWRGLHWPALATGVGVILSVFLVGALLELPFNLYETFVIEQRFGFNRQTPRLFVADLLKGTALALILGGPLATVVLWLMLKAGGLWWLYVWLVWFGFSLLMAWAFPTFIAPLFNRFQPLEDSALRERIERLLDRNGFSARGIFVMDGSRRSQHGNAYFTGLGTSKRIVFFDTLLEKLAGDEVEAVLAHEVGHFKRRHVIKRMATMAVASLAGLAVLGWLIQAPWFYRGLGVSTPSAHMALLLFMLALPVFTFFLQPVLAWISRRHEFEADDFAAGQADPETLVRALVKLYSENASTLTPDPLYSAFHDSHPPAPIRVAHLQAKSHAPA